MIGDWVTIKDEKRHGKVTELCVTQYMEGGEWEEELCVDDFCEQFSNVAPIPLTPEILEANGFSDRKNAGFQRLPTKSIERLVTLYYRDGIFCDGVPFVDEDISMIKNIKYVHKLQHALRLCGLEELADNFKVN